MLNKTKARYSIKIKYTDSNGAVVEKMFEPKDTIFYEFVAQGQMFYVQTLVSDQKIIDKDSVASLANFYVPTKNILDLQVTKTLRLNEADKAGLLFDMFDVEPKANPVALPEDNAPAVETEPTA